MGRIPAPPVQDDRYFTAGTDNVILQNIPLYDAEQYEQIYPFLFAVKPEIFSINLRQELGQFIASAPPMFGVNADCVIELACYYYCDWDSVVAVTDEFIQADVINKVRDSLIAAHYDVAYAENMLQEYISVLSQALTQFIGVVIGVLSRMGAPAIMDYGCCYRLEQIDDNGNVYFRLRNPTVVYAELEGEEVPDRDHCGDFKGKR